MLIGCAAGESEHLEVTQEMSPALCGTLGIFIRP